MTGILFRFLVTRIVRLFYARMEVASQGLSTAPPQTIFVLNHPNGVLDPAIIITILGRTVTFLTKSTPFAYPTTRWVLNQFGAIPIYRPRDIGVHGGAESRQHMNELNDATFARCRARLQSGRPVALFPEGTSHSEPRMMPMRTGAARIALSAAESLGWTAPQIVPVGLWYENTTRFRSAVLVVPGRPLQVAEYERQYREDAWRAVQDLTARIEERLRAVVLEAETSELLKSVPVVAGWTLPEGRKPDLSARQAWAAELLAGYRKMHKRNPRRLARIESAARRYASMLHTLGIKDPWKLEEPRPVVWYAVKRVLILLAWSPLALIGALLSFVPYRAAAYVVRHRFPDNRQKAGTLKLVAGTILVVATWIIEAAVVGLLAGMPWGLALAALAPLSGYIAIRWLEVMRKLQEVVRAGWLRRRRGGLVACLAAERRKLAQEIQEGLSSLQSSP